nr:MAG TPA: hypothetical protein [Caudoviricetes sp.]
MLIKVNFDTLYMCYRTYIYTIYSSLFTLRILGRMEVIL